MRKVPKTSRMIFSADHLPKYILGLNEQPIKSGRFKLSELNRKEEMRDIWSERPMQNVVSLNHLCQILFEYLYHFFDMKNHFKQALFTTLNILNQNVSSNTRKFSIFRQNLFNEIRFLYTNVNRLPRLFEWSIIQSSSSIQFWSVEAATLKQLLLQVCLKRSPHKKIIWRIPENFPNHCEIKMESVIWFGELCNFIG